MKIRRKLRQKKTHGVAWFFITSLGIFLGVCGAIYLGLASLFNAWLVDLPDPDNTQAFTFSEESTVYASDGTTVLATFRLENRTPLDSLDQISDYLINATVDTEDTRFYLHNGVDYYGLARAVVNNLLGGELQGASTITQQLVRNTILSSEATEQTIRRKIREAELAIRMEQLYTKDEILLMYLNTINYGDGCYGIEAAAQHYFSCSAADLTLVQAATLAGIPQSPTYLNPVNYPEDCKNRRNAVLERMLAAGDLTQEGYKVAIAQPLELNLSTDSSLDGIERYSYFTSYVRELLLDQFSLSDLYEGGLSIYTTLDVDAQEAAEAAVERAYAEYTPEGLEYALVAVDPDNGNILAMIGGKDYTESQYNIATTKGRQTGSTFKTFTLVTAIEQGINPSTFIDCSSPYVVQLNEETEVTFSNADDEDYGVISITDAVVVSANTGFVRLQEKVGASNIISTAQRLGIVDAALPDVLSLTLGVADITPLEMAKAYATLASGGIRNDTNAITKIVNKSGVVIYNAVSTSERAISASVAGAVTDVLEQVSLRGTAAPAYLCEERPVASKTGSSDGNHDRWTCCYTPSLSLAIWVGDRNNVLESETNTTIYVAKDTIDAYYEGKEVEEFPEYTAPSYTNAWNTEQNNKLYMRALDNIPNVIGDTREEAAARLAAYKFTFVEELSDTIPNDTVISWEVVDNQIVLNVSKNLKQLEEEAAAEKAAREAKEAEESEKDGENADKDAGNGSGTN